MPAGWAKAGLLEITELHDSRRFPLNQAERAAMPGDYPYYGANGQVDVVGKFLFEGTHILLAEDGGYFDQPERGVAYLVNGQFWVNNHAHVLSMRGGLPASYALRALNAVDWMKFVSGTTRLKLTQGAMQRVEIPLPPLAEQRRIVAKLDALTARLARARAELDRVAVLAAKLRLVALRQAFANGLKIAEPKPISTFLRSLDQGWSPKCENIASTSDGDWAVLKTTAVQALRFLPSENKLLPPDLTPKPLLEITAGDILVTRAGPRVRVGISCVVENTRPKLILADKIYRLRCNRHKAMPQYLALILNSPQARDEIEIMKTGISDSGLNITQDKFLSLQIPALDLQQQRKVVESAAITFARADRLESEAARARALLDRLESAVLTKAFRGELVPQDPADEPASVLLDRIRAQREAAPAPKRGRRAAAA